MAEPVAFAGGRLRLDAPAPNVAFSEGVRAFGETRAPQWLGR